MNQFRTSGASVSMALSIVGTSIVGTSIIGMGVVGVGVVAEGVQLADGKVYFERPPSLVNATATVHRLGATNARYYFDLNVPVDAGEPLQRVTIAQEGGNSFVRQVEFDDDEAQAFLGSRRRRGEEVAIASSVWNEDTQTVTIEFATPIAPGTDVTIRLEPERNPELTGIYLFGVTAFPAGDNSQGQFLGYGRFGFSSNQSI
ncbi:MAG: DUF2808 domain-containing protein [Leptolyngbyaceae bacterium]|nr:DUF2808 domain-containing protein [Leptolyngbyaceae bacterium]